MRTLTSIDGISIVGMVIALIPIVTYLFIFKEHYKVSKNRHAQILQLRFAAIFLVYPLLMAICLPLPNLFSLMEALISFFEGYSILSYWGMLVAYVGGVDATVRIMDTQSRFGCSCLSASQYFSVINNLILLLVTVKPFVDLLITFAEYGGYHYPNLRFLSLFFLVVGMIGLLRGYRALSDSTHEVDAKGKIIFIKLIIILLAIQEAVINTLFASKVISTDSGLSEYNEEQKERRFVALAVILEFGFLSAFMKHVFKPTLMSKEEQAATDPLDLVPKESFCDFFCAFLSFSYVLTPYPMYKGELLGEEGNNQGFKISSPYDANIQGSNTRYLPRLTEEPENYQSSYNA